MDVEAVLLTGGKSSRMGFDKSKLLVDGEPVANRIAKALTSVVRTVTILGREPIPGFGFHKDAEVYGGPLLALHRYVPHCDLVFVCACDMPYFDPRIVTVLHDKLALHEPDSAVMPVLDGHLQPLCGLYRRSALSMTSTVAAEGRQNIMAWLDMLWVESVEEHVFVEAGIAPRSLRSANTPEDWAELTGIHQTS